MEIKTYSHMIDEKHSVEVKIRQISQVIVTDPETNIISLELIPVIDSVSLITELGAFTSPTIEECLELYEAALEPQCTKPEPFITKAESTQFSWMV